MKIKDAIVYLVIGVLLAGSEAAWESNHCYTPDGHLARPATVSMVVTAIAWPIVIAGVLVYAISGGREGDCK